MNNLINDVDVDSQRLCYQYYRTPLPYISTVQPVSYTVGVRPLGFIIALVKLYINLLSLLATNVKRLMHGQRTTPFSNLCILLPSESNNSVEVCGSESSE